MHGDETATGRGCMMTEFLADRDTPCPGCTYNLRGLTGSVCPECSQPLELSITLSEGRVGQLIAAVVGPAMGAGSAAALLATIVVIVTLQSKSWPRGDEAKLLIWTPGAILLCLGVPAIMLARRTGRVWFRQRSTGTRRWIVVLAWVLPVLCFLGFVRMLLVKM
jgi:hypothetical protein